MSGGSDRSEFARAIAETAGALRARIESEVTGLDEAPAAIAARRAAALAADGFETFSRTYFPHYIAHPNSRLHDYLYARLPEILSSGRGEKDAIAAPRGEAKSTLCAQLFPLWCLARRARNFVLVIMDAYDQAAVMVEAIKTELACNPRLALDFPELAGQGRIWKEGVLVARTGAKVQALGAMQRLRGLRNGPHRPDLVVLDDIENDENVRSPEQRDKREAWIDKAVLNVGAADDRLVVLYIGTILHYDSVLARKRAHPLWHSRTFQAVVTWPDRMDLWQRWEEILRNEGEPAAEAFRHAQAREMERGAQVSWPSVRPFPALMRIRLRVGAAAFDAEYQNDPIGEEGAAFGTLAYWTAPSDDWIYFGACDPSMGKQNAGRDPSAILVGGYDRKTGVLDIVEAEIARRLPDRIIEDIIALQARYGCVRWGVETVQFQAFFADELVKRGAARGVPVPVQPIRSLSDKTLRIERLQPHVANGLIRFHPGQSELLRQLRHWPMADHDDGPDAVEMLWQVALTGAAPVDYAPVARRPFAAADRRNGEDRHASRGTRPGWKGGF
jgi:predicted phage terminase large subunit-like protein